MAAYHTDNFLPFLSPRIYIKIKLTSSFSSVCVDCLIGAQNTMSKYDSFPQYFPQYQTLNIALLNSQVSNDSLGQFRSDLGGFRATLSAGEMGVIWWGSQWGMLSLVGQEEPWLLVGLVEQLYLGTASIP